LREKSPLSEIVGKGLFVLFAVGEGKRGLSLRSCHTRKRVLTVRFRFQKRYVAQKGSKKPIQPMGLRDKRVPFLEAPPLLV